jgi:hypothetical protein
MSKNLRRINQRIHQRAVRDLEFAEKRKQELEAILSKTGPIIYDPNINEIEGSLGNCSVCSKKTRKEHDLVLLCSDVCKKMYMRQFEQFGLNPKKGANILFRGQKLIFLTWMLKKNSEGEPCLRAYNPELEDEHNKAPEILIPFSARKCVIQIKSS